MTINSRGIDWTAGWISLMSEMMELPSIQLIVSRYSFHQILKCSLIFHCDFWDHTRFPDLFQNQGQAIEIFSGEVCQIWIIHIRSIHGSQESKQFSIMIILNELIDPDKSYNSTLCLVPISASQSEWLEWWVILVEHRVTLKVETPKSRL